MRSTRSLVALVAVAPAFMSGGCMVVPLVDYGDEVEAVEVVVDEPFVLRYSPRHPGDHRLWIDHTLEFEDWHFSIEGPLTVETPAGNVLREVHVDLNGCDGPVDPLVRIEAGTSEWTQFGSRVWMSSTVYAIDVPGGEVGGDFVLRGEWSATDDVDVESLWLVVTD